MKYLQKKYCSIAVAAALTATGTVNSALAVEFEEIVVTASKREASLQSESRQMVAVGGEELALNGAVDASTFANLVPGLTISKSGVLLQVYIRGVGDRSANAFGGPAVASNMDGVYIPRSSSVGGLFFDLERIEVLKGPQGTLYGRNASAGAINLISVKPDGETGGFLEAELGNYDSQRIAGAIGFPVTENFSARIAAQLVDKGGYLSDGTNDDETQGVRMQGLYTPSDDFSLLLSATYTKQGGLGGGRVIKDPRVGGDYVGMHDPRTLPVFKAYEVAAGNNLFDPLPIGSGVFPASDPSLDVDTFVFSAQMDWKISENVMLTVLPSYFDSDVNSVSWTPGIPIHTDQQTDQPSLEVRLASDGDSDLEWVVGAIYGEETIDDFITFYLNEFSGLNIQRDYELVDTSYGLFGEAKYHFNDSFRVNLGLRQSWTDKTMDGSQKVSLPTFGVEIPSTFAGDESWNSTDFRIGVEYDVADEVTLFATVSTGYKAGGFYGSSILPNSYEPEELTSYELGMKGTFLDGRFQFNFESFYWDYSDHQESFVSVLPDSTTGFLTVNAGKAELYGFDLNMKALVGESGILTFEYNYLKSEYSDYIYESQAGGPTYGCIETPATSAPGIAAGYITRDCSGYQLVRAPTSTGRIAYSHIHDFESSAEVILTAQARFSSSYWLSNEFDPRAREDGFTVVDLTATYRSPGETYELSAFVRNLGDTVAYNGANVNQNNFVAVEVQSPRMYGVRLRYNF